MTPSLEAAGPSLAARRAPVWVEALVMAAATFVVALWAMAHDEEHASELPTGCDDYGNYALAQAIHQGTVFDANAHRPFDPALTDWLRAHGKRIFGDTFNYSFIIAPHAHHVDDRTFKVIDQYPPGTALVLAAFPWRLQRLFFPAVCVLLWVIPVFLGLRLGAGAPAHVAGGVAIAFAIACLKLSPVPIVLPAANSTMPTYGLLAAAGLLVRRRPLWACALIGTASLFRVANVVLLLPALWAIVFDERRAPGDRVRRFVTGPVKGVACLLAGGFGIYLAYAWMLLGNPFAPTYSPIDRQWNTFDWPNGMLQHAARYFSFSEPWFVTHLGALGLCLATSIAFERRLRWFLVALAAAAVNYAFYVAHFVWIFYYPYATAVFAIGVAVEPLIRAAAAGGRIVRFVPAIAALAGLCWIGPDLRWPDSAAVSARIDAQVAAWREAFGGFDVVWADEHTGTIEYATGRAGFRYHWSDPNTRHDIMRWLAGHGFTQAVWMDDIPTLENDAGKIESVAGLVQERKPVPGFGTCVVLRLK